VGEFYREIQRSLSANRWQQCELPFAAGVAQHLALNTDDLFKILARERLDICAISQLRISHDGGGVGIRQHHFIAFLLERLASLRAGVIKLRRLPDDDGPGADDEDL